MEDGEGVGRGGEGGEMIGEIEPTHKHLLEDFNISDQY